MGLLSRFTLGTLRGMQSFVDKLNAIVDAVNGLDNVRGDDVFISVTKGPNARLVSLNLQKVLERVPKIPPLSAGGSVTTKFINNFTCGSAATTNGPGTITLSSGTWIVGGDVTFGYAAGDSPTPIRFFLEMRDNTHTSAYQSVLIGQSMFTDMFTNGSGVTLAIPVKKFVVNGTVNGLFPNITIVGGGTGNTTVSINLVAWKIG